MIINSIKLKNFKSYEEETTLNLKPQAGKNIILIGGENGAGKSTLFQAIKLCFYGATAFGYIGQNHYYIELVKSYINNNAFSHDKINSYVELDVSFNSSDENDHYTLRRSWTYEKEKINEEFLVFHNQELLENEELDYFDQYLKSTIPPSLFNFFFFDGEELGSFFTAKSSKQSLKESILELFNFNTFELLQKQLKSYQKNQSKHDSELKTAQQEYDSITEQLNELTSLKESIIQQVEDNMIELDNLQAQKEKIDTDFRQQGGLLEEEQDLLNIGISKLEAERAESSLKIREFCNNKLPFLLIPKHLSKLAIQIKQEQQLSEYEAFRKRLDPSTIVNSIKSVKDLNVSVDESNAIADYILANTFDQSKLNGTDEILGLSKEQSHSILTLCKSIQEYYANPTFDVLEMYEHIDQITALLKDSRMKLNSTVTKEQLQEYMDSLNKIAEKSANIKATVDYNKLQIAMFEEQSIALTNAHTKAKNKLIELLQNSNMSNISLDLINYFDILLKTVTTKKTALIEKEFIHIFKNIIRKDNFIDDIKFDENFSPTLYIYKQYSVSELLNICYNLGTKNLIHKYGILFVQDLYQQFDATEETLLDHLWRYANTKTLYTLHTKINVDLLSSGEKQVYVLCLIWAILKVSNVDIPFIIDTPYARIDTTHRNALTTLYLPQISNQVVILSTNEEIDPELYKTLEPFIANEHLLMYDANLRKTTVKNTYFEV